MFKNKKVEDFVLPKVSNEEVEYMLKGTILNPILEACNRVTRDRLPLEISLSKTLSLAGCALSGRNMKIDPNMEDASIKPIDRARVKINTAGGQAMNIWALLIAESGAKKDIGNIIGTTASRHGYSIGSCGSAEGIADALIDNGNGLLTISEMQNWLDAKHWQSHAQSFLVTGWNAGDSRMRLSNRGGGKERWVKYLYPNIYANIQPDILKMKLNAESIANGFIGRFLIFNCQDSKPNPSFKGDMSSYEAAASKALNILEKKECSIDVSDDMEEFLQEVVYHHFPKYKSPFNRLASEYYHRLSAMLSISENDNNKEIVITDEALRKAERLVYWFMVNHISAFGNENYDLCPADRKRNKLKEAIMKHMKKNSRTPVRKIKTSFHQYGAKAIDEAILELVDIACISNDIGYVEYRKDLPE